MNQNKIVLSITLLMGALLTAFMFSWYQQQNNVDISVKNNELERQYSVSFGPETAKVTIVEFFDPACEACRAFYPFVKKIMNENPDEIRLVLRYAAFHEGSDEVVLMLEAARRQGLYSEVLVSILAGQNSWASHSKPNLANVWNIAESAGLDISKAREDMEDPDIIQVLEQDTADVKSLGIQKTPTFFVNGKPLESFGSQQLYDLVQSELK
ncbi:TPA: thioredoxin domain-containing protein [Vibrio parahaemolyticus]|nr:thioredoxin domain-containing protein [Vibrio parahaemolyticus]